MPIPRLVRRLAAAQLNLIPQGDTPVLLVAAANSPVTDWIDATVTTDIRPEKLKAASMLSRLANGPHRLWLFGGGIMSVFVGLLLSPAPVRLRKRSEARFEMEGDASGRAALISDEHSNKLTAADDSVVPEGAVTDLIDVIAPVDVEAEFRFDEEDAAGEVAPDAGLSGFQGAEAEDEIAEAAGDDAHAEVGWAGEGEPDAVKATVLLEPRMEPVIEVSAFDLLDADLQDELNEIEQADDRTREPLRSEQHAISESDASDPSDGEADPESPRMH